MIDQAALIMNILREWGGKRTLRGHYYDLKIIVVKKENKFLKTGRGDIKVLY